jgi:hypothetical protein
MPDQQAPRRKAEANPRSAWTRSHTSELLCVRVIETPPAVHPPVVTEVTAVLTTPGAEAVSRLRLFSARREPVAVPGTSPATEAANGNLGSASEDCPK